MREKPEQVAADLGKVVRGEVFADILHRAAYSTDASIYRIVPVCVVSPIDVRDIVAVVKYAGAKGVPVAACGAGSGLAGTFGMQKKNYDLSSKISERLAEALKLYTTRYVLTECSACKMQIEHVSEAIVRHPVKILAEVYGVLK